MGVITDRIKKGSNAMPDWAKWIGGCAIGGISSAVTIGVMIGVSQTRLAGAESRVIENRDGVEVNRADIAAVKDRIGVLQVKVESSTVRSEEQYRSIMQMLRSIEDRLP